MTAGKEHTRQANPIEGEIMAPIPCRSCGKNVPQSKFCNQCGAPMQGSQNSVFEQNEWVSREDEFASCVHIRDLEGWFKKKLRVGEGTKALMLEGTESIGEVPPGEYTLDTFLGRINRFGKSKDITAVITKTGDLPVGLRLSGIKTKEFLDVDVKVSLGVRIQDIALFYKNCMGKSGNISALDVRKRIFPSINHTIRQCIAGCSIEQLQQDLTLSAKFESAVEGALSERLEHFGLQFNGLKTVDYEHTAYEDLDKAIDIHSLSDLGKEKGRCYLQIEREKARLEHKTLLDDLYTKEELQNIQQLERKNELAAMVRDLQIDKDEGDLAADFRRFEAIDKRRLELDNLKRFTEGNSTSELEAFLVELEKSELLRKEDIESLRRGYEERKEDAESARQHIVRLLTIQRNQEVETAKIEALHQQKLASIRDQVEVNLLTESEQNRQKSVQLDQQFETARKEREEALRSARENRIRQEEEAGFKRSEAEKDEFAKAKLSEITRSSSIAEEKTRVEIAKLRRADDQEAFDTALVQDKKSHELNMQMRNDAIQALDGMRKVKHDDRVRKTQLERESAEHAAKLETDQKDAAHRQELEKERHRMEMEAKKIEALQSASPEVLISVSGTEQAALLADLQKTKVMEGWSSEQILAAAAEKSPAVAEAFKEKFRAAQAGELSDRERGLYEKMLTESKSSKDDISGVYKSHLEMTREMAEKAMSEVSKVASSFASKDSNVVVVGANGMQISGSGTSNSGTAQAGGRVFICSKCRAENDSSARCCSNCGSSF